MLECTTTTATATTTNTLTRIVNRAGTADQIGCSGRAGGGGLSLALNVVWVWQALGCIVRGGLRMMCSGVAKKRI